MFGFVHVGGSTRRASHAVDLPVWLAFLLFRRPVNVKARAQLAIGNELGERRAAPLGTAAVACDRPDTGTGCSV